jgi:seryl-tRNA synthetase
MHDMREIRKDPDAFAAAMAARGVADGAVADLVAADAAKRAAEGEMQLFQQRRNELARLAGRARQDGGDTGVMDRDGRVAGERLAELERTARDTAARLADMLGRLPNTASSDVPAGTGEADNAVLGTTGEAAAEAWQRPHWEFAAPLGLDIEAGVALAGTRFAVLRGGMARLERALGQWMLDLHTGEHGYEEVAVPNMVRPEILHGTGQLPKFADDLFPAGGGHFLIPTAEVPLTNLARGQALDPAALPLRLTALTPCYRAEAGAAGRDTRGYMRQHQFHKVELVSVVLPEDADAEHERMTRCAETVLARLGLAWRRVALCTGDMGFSAARTFDLEVWMPGQRAWREISSCSTCGDFQARRMGAKLRGRKDLPHTLNGSGVAVGRALAAVLEANQRADGTVAVPPVLVPYMAGLERLELRAARPG